MRRRYERLLATHFSGDRQMAFLSGPRQVGKTTTSRAFTEKQIYFSWENEDHQRLILSGPTAVADAIGLTRVQTIVFDELHKYTQWKTFIKGFFDTYESRRFRIVVTGSARLDAYRKGADSLMGRYFLYRMHPLSVAEIVSTCRTEGEISAPGSIGNSDFKALIHFGGFPEPWLKRDLRFYRRWKTTRLKLLFREELRDTTRIQEIGQVELLAEFMRRQSGQLMNYASLARKIRASQDSIRRWVSVLESLYHCFLLRPWTRNIPRSLLKDPKVYLWDWSVLDDRGAVHENLVACHLLKAVHWWQDCGYGDYDLHFLRTKEKREVDFVVSRNGKPWFLVEVKSTADSNPLRNLTYFQEKTGAEHAFQVIIDADYVDADSFDVNHPVRVPARTFLSQLI